MGDLVAKKCFKKIRTEQRKRGGGSGNARSQSLLIRPEFSYSWNFCSFKNFTLFNIQYVSCVEKAIFEIKKQDRAEKEVEADLLGPEDT